jgi:hypothetical protein
MANPDESNRQALLAAEAAALYAINDALTRGDSRLRRALKQAATPARKRTEAQRRAFELEGDVQDTIAQSIVSSKAHAVAQHKEELGAAIVLLWPQRKRLELEARLEALDVARARSASRALVAPYTASVLRDTRVDAKVLQFPPQGGHPYRSPAQQATIERRREPEPTRNVRALTSQLQRVAATESATAYNAQRVTLVEAEVARSPELVEEYEWVWDATLDKRTCSRCESMSRLRWALSESPSRPPLHPLCRCTLSLRRLRIRRAA